MTRAPNAVVRLPERLLDMSPERLIAISRLVLAAVALAAIWLDPDEPTLDPALTYLILVGYLAYAAAYAGALAVLPPLFRLHIATHVIDIAVFATLMLLVDGSTSPFFVLFTFALFVATLRWNWQGALITTIVLAALFVALHVIMAMVPGPPEELTRTIIRGGFLLVAGFILTYLGALRERARQRIAKLADWPAEAACDEEVPPLQKTLIHAASVAQAARALVVWETAEEPYRYLAWNDDEGFHFERQAPAETPVVDAALGETAILLLDARTGAFRTRNSALIRRDHPLDSALVQAFAIKQAAVAPVKGERLSGHVILMEIGRASEELFALAEIIASRVAGQIEHHMLHRELAEAAAARERMRLARNVHDSALQTMTAIGLHLAALKGKAGKMAQPAIEELQQIVADQQRHMRDFVVTFRQPAIQPLELMPLIGRVLREAAAQWRCTASLRVDPPNLQVGATVASELSLMVMEAIANAVRHGGASRLELLIEATQAGISLEITDNGGGIQPGSATLEDDAALSQSIGSRSLRDRAQALGASITFSSGPSGTTVRIELPPACP